MSPRLLVALTLATKPPGASRASRVRGRRTSLSTRSRPTGPRELTIETHDYEAHESTMVLPFEDTHACLLQSRP